MNSFRNYLSFLLLSSCLILITKAKTDLLFEEYGTLGTKADFYDEEFLSGVQTTIETDGPCKNLPRRWRKKAKSVDTRGTCVLACTEIECEGTCKRIYAAHGEQQLKTIQMDNAISSIKSCFK